MTSKRPHRALRAGLMLLALASAPLAPARAGEANFPVAPETDSLWGIVTCGFALSLSRYDPGFMGSAMLICHFIETRDGGI